MPKHPCILKLCEPSSALTYNSLYPEPQVELQACMLNPNACLRAQRRVVELEIIQFDLLVCTRIGLNDPHLVDVGIPGQ